MEDIAQRSLRVVDLRLQVVPLSDHRRVQSEAGADGKAPLVVRVAAPGRPRAKRAARIKYAAAVIQRIDLMQGAHNLSRAPCLIYTQIADDVRHLKTALRTWET